MAVFHDNSPQSMLRNRVITLPECERTGVDLNAVWLRERLEYNTKREVRERRYRRMRMEPTLLGSIRLWWEHRHPVTRLRVWWRRAWRK